MLNHSHYSVRDATIARPLLGPAATVLSIPTAFFVTPSTSQGSGVPGGLLFSFLQRGNQSGSRQGLNIQILRTGNGASTLPSNSPARPAGCAVSVPALRDAPRSAARAHSIHSSSVSASCTLLDPNLETPYSNVTLYFSASWNTWQSRDFRHAPGVHNQFLCFYDYNHFNRSAAAVDPSAEVHGAA